MSSGAQAPYSLAAISARHVPCQANHPQPVIRRTEIPSRPVYPCASQLAQSPLNPSPLQRGGRMPLSKIREYLDSHDVKYLVISHSLAYTAQGVAALAHVSGKKLAKTVILKIDGVLAMAVVPASAHVDLDRLRVLTGCNAVEIAAEQEFQNAFPDCELGAIPPFG